MNLRISKLQRALKEFNYDACLIEDPINLFYFTHLDLSAGKLIVFENDAYLIVDSRYFEICKRLSPVPVLLKSDQNNPLKDVLLKNKALKTVAFSSDKATYRDYQSLKSLIDEVMVQENKSIEIVPSDTLIPQIRAIKDAEEIDLLKTSADLCAKGFDFVCEALKAGITEKEIATQLEIFWKEKGGQALSFEPIIAFGKNSSMPHYRAQNVSLKSGDVVLIDIGVKFRHYHSDMTRVVFFKKTSDEMLKIYEVVKKAQAKALNLCKAGVIIAEVDRAARKVISDAGYGEYFIHSLGHGVGLEVHEMPTLRDNPTTQNQELKEGMCITIEPGIYLSHLGGVRIEDTILITKEGYENLTKRPVEPVVVN